MLTAGGACVDLMTDPNHCGTLGTTCADQCLGGVCVATGCGAGLQNCGDACVDTETDPLNCGGCGDVCNRDEVCVRGNCENFEVGAGCTMCPCPTRCTGDVNTCCTYPGTADVICVDNGRCPVP